MYQVSSNEHTRRGEDRDEETGFVAKLLATNHVSCTIMHVVPLVFVCILLCMYACTIYVSQGWMYYGLCSKRIILITDNYNYKYRYKV